MLIHLYQAIHKMQLKIINLFLKICVYYIETVDIADPAFDITEFQNTFHVIRNLGFLLKIVS